MSFSSETKADYNNFFNPSLSRIISARVSAIVSDCFLMCVYSQYIGGKLFKHRFCENVKRILNRIFLPGATDGNTGAYKTAWNSSTAPQITGKDKEPVILTKINTVHTTDKI